MAAAGGVDADRAALDLLQRRVLNVVGHELRTPITTLRGLAELLGRDDDPAATAELHAAIRRVARRAEALLDDLLVATGVSTALPVGAATPSDVVAEARAVWAELDLELDGLPALEVEGSGSVALAPGVLRRVLAPLLANAARHGSAPVSLRVATASGGRTSIVVADRGPGIPAAEVPLVVEPFFRGDRAVLDHHALGLGLAVAAALVRQHDGTLDVRNRAGGGVEVEVVL